MSSEVSLPISAGARLHLRLPDGAIAEPDAALPAVDVSALPGATLPVRVGFRAIDAGVELRAICARAPSDRWAPGVEELVLGRATSIARGALGGDVERLDASEILLRDHRFEQRFDARVTRAGEARAAHGAHLLGFADQGRDAILCSITCTEREPARACVDLVAGAAAEGAWTPAPPPSMLVRAVLFAAERPLPAASAAGALILAIVAIVLARRPRPRP